MKSDVTILISCYDPYSPCWPVLCHSLHKYWPDCPWPIQFVTNHLEPPCGMEPIKVGNRNNWTTATRFALQQVDTEIILLLLDDYWLLSPIDTPTVKKYAGFLTSGNINHLKLEKASPAFRSDFSGDDRLYIFADRTPYRAALNAAFWRVETLLSLLKDGENAWQYDWHSSERSYGMSGFIGVKKNGCFRRLGQNPRERRGAVVKRKWTASAKKYVDDEGLDIDIVPGTFISQELARMAK